MTKWFSFFILSVYEFTFIAFKLFLQITDKRLVLTFLASLVGSFFVKDLNLVMCIGLGLFAVISRNTYLLRKKYGLKPSMFLKSVQEFTQLEGIVYAWTYLSILLLLTGFVAKYEGVQSLMGLCKSFYIANLLLAVCTFARAFIFLCKNGVKGSFFDFLLFFVGNIVPILLIEITFNGLALYGVPNELLIAKVGEDKFFYSRAIFTAACGATLYPVGERLVDLVLGPRASPTPPTPPADQQGFAKTEDVKALTDEVKGIKERLDSILPPTSPPVPPLTIGDAKATVREPVNQGFAVQGLPKPVSEAEPVVTDGPAVLPVDNPDTEVGPQSTVVAGVADQSQEKSSEELESDSQPDEPVTGTSAPLDGSSGPAIHTVIEPYWSVLDLFSFLFYFIFLF